MAAHHSRKDFLDALFRDYYKEYPGFVLIKTSLRNDTKVGSRFFQILMACHENNIPTKQMSTSGFAPGRG